MQEELELQIQEKAEWGTNYQKRLENSLKSNQISFGEILSINKQEMQKYSKEQQQLHDGLK